MRNFLAPSSTPKIQVVGAKPNLLAQLAGGGGGGGGGGGSSSKPDNKPATPVK